MGHDSSTKLHSVQNAALGITPRQQEIAVLVAKGYTNAQIAEALVLVPGTVANHLDHLRTRLGLQNRAQVAAWVVKHGLLGESHDQLEPLEAMEPQ
jgi:DNA-binding NarL/FixJ family response regulator